MAVTCTDCHTSNRDGARFCRGCGHRLSSVAAEEEWPATQRMVFPYEEIQSQGAEAAIALPLRAQRQKPPSPSPKRPASADPAPPRRSPPAAKSVGSGRPSRAKRAILWSALVALIVAVGAWHLRESTVSTLTAVTSPGPSVAAAPAPAPAPPDPVFAAEPVPPEPVPAPEPPAVVPEPAIPAKPAPAPKARKTVVPLAPAPPVASAEAQPVASVPAPEPAAPSDPQAVCGNLNFFSRARCMAAQCAKAEYTAHPRCDAVRRQQQIEEEKRNPSLLN